MIAYERRRYEGALENVRRSLGDAEFSRAYAEGARMSVADAVALAERLIEEGVVASDARNATVTTESP